MTSSLADARTAYLAALADAAAIELAAFLADFGRPGATVIVVEPDLFLRSVELIEVVFADGTTMGRDDLDDVDVPLCVHQGFDNVEALGEWAANAALGNIEELRVPSDRAVRDAINGMRAAIDTAASHDAASLSDLIGATNGVVAALRSAGTDSPMTQAALNAMDGWHTDIDTRCTECFGNGGFDADGDATEHFDPDDGGSACGNCEGSGSEPDDVVTAATIELFTARWEAVNAAYGGHTAPRAPEAYTPLHVADECDECGADLTGTTAMQSWAHDRTCSLFPANEVGYGQVFATLAADAMGGSAAWHGSRPTRLTVRADVSDSEVGTGPGVFDVIGAKGPDYERAYRGNDWWELCVPADVADPTRRALSMAAGGLLADMPEGLFVFDLDVPPAGPDDGDSGPVPDGDGPEGRLAAALAGEIERRTGDRPVRIDVAAEVAVDQVGSGTGDVFVLNYRTTDGAVHVREQTAGWALHPLADDSVAHVAEVRDATERFLVDMPAGVTPANLVVPQPCGWCGAAGGAVTLRADHAADCAAREAFCAACDQIVRGTDWGHLPEAHANGCPDPVAPARLTTPASPHADPCRCGGVEECECPPPKPCDHCQVEFDDHAAATRPALGHDPACPFTLATFTDPLMADVAVALAGRAPAGAAGRWVRAIAAHAEELADHPVVLSRLLPMIDAAADAQPVGTRPDGLAGSVADALVARGVEPGRANGLCADGETWDRWIGPMVEDVGAWVGPLGGMSDAAVADAAVEAVKRTRGVNAKAARRLIGQLGGPHADDTVRRVVAAAVGPVTRHTVDELLARLLPEGWTVAGGDGRVVLVRPDGIDVFLVRHDDWAVAAVRGADGRHWSVATGLPADGGSHPVKAARRIAALAERD